jgi:hypothetical protein
MSRSFLPSCLITFSVTLVSAGISGRVVVGLVALESSLQGADRVAAAKTFEPSAVLSEGSQVTAGSGGVGGEQRPPSPILEFGAPWGVGRALCFGDIKVQSPGGVDPIQLQRQASEEVEVGGHEGGAASITSPRNGYPATVTASRTRRSKPSSVSVSNTVALTMSWLD